MSQKNNTPQAQQRDDLLRRVKQHLETYVAFQNENHSLVLSLWILHTHAFDAADVTPYVYVSSVDPGAGKTTLMETLADLARTPQDSSNISASYLFRKVEADKPTLFIDEVDTIYSGSKNEELRSVLNSGYLYNGKTTKTINGEPTELSTFCPKLIGGIDNGMLPETVVDRCIRVRLRKLSGDKLAELNVQRRNIRKLRRDESLDTLKHDLAMWANVEMINKLADLEPKMIEGLSARQWDITEPLMQIAMVFGITKEAREAIVAVFKGEKVETEETRILTAAKELLDGTESDRLTTSALASMTGITPDRLGRILSKLGAKPRPIKVAGQVTRGVYRPDLEAAWEKYL